MLSNKKEQEKSVKREKQRERITEWRRKWYVHGFTYREIGGKWGWARKKGRKPAKIHHEQEVVRH
jgi:hypothetical protein